VNKHHLDENTNSSRGGYRFPGTREQSVGGATDLSACIRESSSEWINFCRGHELVLLVPDRQAMLQSSMYGQNVTNIAA
jgi:hypothetical protein